MVNMCTPVRVVSSEFLGSIYCNKHTCAQETHTRMFMEGSTVCDGQKLETT